MQLEQKWFDEKTGLYQCPECGKLYSKKGICSHIIIKHTKEGIERHSKTLEKRHFDQTGKPAWNSGLTKETSESVKKSGEKISKSLQKTVKEGRCGFQQYMKNSPDEWIQSCSKGGGLRKMSGRGHRGWYKGFYCQSSWELAFVVYCLDHQIKIERNLKSFTYIFEEKEHKYYPDFYVNEEYIEIKGYKDKKCKAKIEQFTEKLRVLEKDDMKTYVDYVTEKYGENFISLYDAGDGS